jgi:hypothetical protein
VGLHQRCYLRVIKSGRGPNRKCYCHIGWYDLYPYMEAADLIKDTHRLSRRLSAERYPHTIRAGRSGVCSLLLDLLLPAACNGGRPVGCTDRILCLLILQSRVSDRGVAKGSFSVPFVRIIAVLGRMTPSAVFSLPYRDRGSYKSRK